MTIPNERTWYAGVDYALPDCSTNSTTALSILYAIKAALMQQITFPTIGATGAIPSGAAWTCYGSSNGTTYNLSGTDLWGSAYTPANIVRQSGGSGAMSWFVLKSPSAIPGGPYYFTILYASGSANIAEFFISKAAPTGGDASHAPTATDATTIFSTTFSSSTSWGAGRFHLSTDANGSTWLLWSKNGTGIVAGAIFLGALTDLRISSDAWPFVFLIDFSEGTGAMAEATNQVYRALSNQGPVFTRYYNGDTALRCGVICWDVGPGTSLATDMAGAFAYDSNYEATSLYVYSFTTGRKGLKGKLCDCWTVSATVVQGSVYPSVGGIQGVLSGNTFLPFTAPITL